VESEQRATGAFGEFDTPEEKFLFAEAQLGIELSNFLRTNVGRYLQGRCELVINDFSGWVLESVDPSSDEFKKRHLKARSAQMLMSFISEAVANGKHAEGALKEADEIEFSTDGPLGL
jgi:hypothetical protein